MAQPSRHHQRQPRCNRERMEEAALQQERVFSIITLLHAASAAALRQKLVQFAMVLHITVIHILHAASAAAHGFGFQDFTFLQAQECFEANSDQ